MGNQEVAIWTLVVAALTLLAATVTLWIAIVGEVRRRRQGPAVHLEVDAFATATVDGEHSHIWRISNIGRRDARILGIKPVSGEICPNERWPTFTMVLHGESHEFMVRSDDISNAWVLVVWQNTHDRRWADVQWWAPEAGTKLMEERDAQITSFLAQRKRRFRRHTVRPVGPGGVIRTRLPTGKRSSTADDIRTAISLTGALEDDE